MTTPAIPGEDRVLNIILKETTATAQKQALANATLLSTLFFIISAVVSHIHYAAAVLIAVMAPVCILHVAWFRAIGRARTVKREYDALPLWERHQVNLVVSRGATKP